MGNWTAEQAHLATWICHGCAVRFARVIPGHCATFHEGDNCGVCGERRWTTEPRDYLWPRQCGYSQESGKEKT